MSRIPITFLSSVKEDVWHDQEDGSAFESWHFDALSDDGSQAVVIKFHDNCPFSPRYYHHGKKANGTAGNKPARLPSVSIVFSVDGKVVASAINEFKPDEFLTDGPGIGVSIGKSGFRVKEAEYGNGFVVSIDILTTGKRRIKAELEWLSIEADLLTAPENAAGSSSWNIVAPRSDVSGRITLFARDGSTKNVHHFRGTGFHDHYRSDLPHNEITELRYSGRGHFVDCTAIFLYLTNKSGQNLSRLFLVRDGVMEEFESRIETMAFVHNRYGLKLPNGVKFTSQDEISVVIRPFVPIESGFCDAKMLNRMTLHLPDKSHRETTGITTFLAPGRLRSRFIRQLSDLRIGKGGRSPLF